MNDLERTELRRKAEADQLRQSPRGHRPMSYIRSTTIIALLDEIDALKLDSRRYQWLRDHYGNLPFCSIELALIDQDAERIDAIIDAVIEAATKEKP